MYNEGQKIKNLNALVSSRDVTEYRSKISQFEDEDKNLFDGVCDLAKNLEVADLVKLLEMDYGLSSVVLEIGNKSGRNCHDCNDHYSCKFQDFENVSGINCLIERGWNHFPNKSFHNVEISGLEIGKDVQ